ncbi:hypothetical protein HMPREF9248_0446 [Fannyhessea vaginae PB189-T1-4]|uniref:Cyanophycin synthase-like N-terminal domain-containing protein n=1 Tax=Fannyhessea vaginae PB189-T1-4 TaxID=866774 RepID=A0ABN0B0Z0_9ACTN|nr:hypothetical protein [Fannyhessea vaginae]EFL44448.1 hypothetical protein HMPREF9248_0446 [Fannyhessea vaginae PB189-T1-4]
MDAQAIQPISITKVEIDSQYFTAHIRIGEETPLFTCDDLEATTRIYDIMPHIIEHACVGDASDTFKDVMGNTELAHLLEHVCVELLSQTDIAGDVPAGKTFISPSVDRGYVLQFTCSDDALVAAAFASAVWIMNWAFSGAAGSTPNCDAIVQAIVAMVGELNSSNTVELTDDELEAYVQTHAMWSADALQLLHKSLSAADPASDGAADPADATDAADEGNAAEVDAAHSPAKETADAPEATSTLEHAEVEEGVTAAESTSTPAVDSQLKTNNETNTEANHEDATEHPNDNPHEHQQNASDAHAQDAPFATQPLRADAISLSDVSQELHIPRSKRVR